MSDGIRTGRGRRAAYLHRDQVNGTLRGRRGARMAALTSGGAIPELGDYRVLAEPDDAVVGTVNEDWAIESMAGDVFLLGTTSWRIRRVEPGIVRVVDAQRRAAFGAVLARRGAWPHPSSFPRTSATSAPRSRRCWGAGRKPGAGRTNVAAAIGWLMAECGIGEAAAETIAAYLGTGARAARHHADHGHDRAREVLRRGRRHAAGRAQSLSGPGSTGRSAWRCASGSA